MSSVDFTYSESDAFRYRLTTKYLYEEFRKTFLNCESKRNTPQNDSFERAEQSYIESFECADDNYVCYVWYGMVARCLDGFSNLKLLISI